MPLDQKLKDRVEELKQSCDPRMRVDLYIQTCAQHRAKMEAAAEDQRVDQRRQGIWAELDAELGHAALNAIDTDIHAALATSHRDHDDDDQEDASAPQHADGKYNSAANVRLRGLQTTPWALRPHQCLREVGLPALTRRVLQELRDIAVTLIDNETTRRPIPWSVVAHAVRAEATKQNKFKSDRGLDGEVKPADVANARLWLLAREGGGWTVATERFRRPKANKKAKRTGIDRQQHQHEEEEPQQQYVGEEPQQQHVGEEPQQQHVGEEPQQQHVGEEPQHQHVGEEPQHQHEEEEPQQQHVVEQRVDEQRVDEEQIDIEQRERDALLDESQHGRRVLRELPDYSNPGSPLQFHADPDSDDNTCLHSLPTPCRKLFQLPNDASAVGDDTLAAPLSPLVVDASSPSRFVDHVEIQQQTSPLRRHLPSRKRPVPDARDSFQFYKIRKVETEDVTEKPLQTARIPVRSDYDDVPEPSHVSHDENDNVPEDTYISDDEDDDEAWITQSDADDEVHIAQSDVDDETETTLNVHDEATVDDGVDDGGCESMQLDDSEEALQTSVYTGDGEGDGAAGGAEVTAYPAQSLDIDQPPILEDPKHTRPAADGKDRTGTHKVDNPKIVISIPSDDDDGDSSNETGAATKAEAEDNARRCLGLDLESKSSAELRSAWLNDSCMFGVMSALNCDPEGMDGGGIRVLRGGHFVKARKISTTTTSAAGQPASLLLIPINVQSGTHWHGVVVDIDHEKIEVYTPFGNEEIEETTQLVIEKLRVRDRMGERGGVGGMYCGLEPVKDIESFEVVQATTKFRQKRGDGVNCGVFVLVWFLGKMHRYIRAREEKTRVERVDPNGDGDVEADVEVEVEDIPLWRYWFASLFTDQLPPVALPSALTTSSNNNDISAGLGFGPASGAGSSVDISTDIDNLSNSSLHDLQHHINGLSQSESFIQRRAQHLLENVFPMMRATIARAESGRSKAEAELGKAKMQLERMEKVAEITGRRGGGEMQVRPQFVELVEYEVRFLKKTTKGLARLMNPVELVGGETQNDNWSNALRNASLRVVGMEAEVQREGEKVKAKARLVRKRIGAEVGQRKRKKAEKLKELEQEARALKEEVGELDVMELGLRQGEAMDRDEQEMGGLSTEAV